MENVSVVVLLGSTSVQWFGSGRNLVDEILQSTNEQASKPWRCEMRFSIQYFKQRWCSVQVDEFSKGNSKES